MPNHSKAVRTENRKVVKAFFRPADFEIIEAICDELDLLPGQFIRQATLERARAMRVQGAAGEVLEVFKQLQQVEKQG